MKTSKRIISILLSVIMVLGVCAIGFNAVADDDGITWNAGANRYEISNYAGLKTFAGIVNGVSNPDNLSSPQSACAILTADIDASASAASNIWTPIGNYDNRYTGIFDGKDRGGVMHKITGLTYNNSDHFFAGLFGYVGESGTVRNVGLEGGSITGKEYTGGVVGYNDGCKVTNCYNTCDVTGSDFVGGVVGYNYGGSISICYNTGDITGNNYTGGVVGANTGIVQDCCNSGTVNGKKRVGGVAGSSYNTVFNCYNTGSVSGSNETGGVAGGNDGKVLNCFYNRNTCIIPDANEDNNWKAIGYSNGTGLNVKVLTKEEFKDPANFTGTTVGENYCTGLFTGENGEYTSDDWVMGSQRPLLRWAVDAGVNYYATGDIIEYGSYPQSRVDETEALRAAAEKATWKSYNYYSGTGDYYDGQMTAGDFMNFADFFLDGEKYRAVYFTEYRPDFVGRQCGADYSYVDNNGYETETYYYFLYEPVEWRVLDPGEGLVMSETILDSQAYNNYIYNDYIIENIDKYYGDEGAETHSVYASDYANSSIRQWLNDDFYNTAFTDAQKENIKSTELDNRGIYSFMGYTQYTDLDSESTNDKVFLLSYTEALNGDYGFSPSQDDNDSARLAQGSDYAKCQGLCVKPNSNSYWRLRSPRTSSGNDCGVDEYGSVSSYCFTSCASDGVRPALKLLNVKSDVTVSVDLYSGIMSAGDIVEYGAYPQSRVTDETAIAALNAQLKEDGWVSYGYYSGDGTYYNGSMRSGDWMKYQDVTLDGAKYRAVTFSCLRPAYTDCAANDDAAYSYQDNNGYTANNVYWFSFDPVEWRVLDPVGGLFLCETIIDSQAFNNYIIKAGEEYYCDEGADTHKIPAGDYAESSIRQWLVNDFYIDAFSDGQIPFVKPRSAVSDDSAAPGFGDPDSAGIRNKLLLLSYDDVLNGDYGFRTDYYQNDSAKSAKGTDYAKCQGLLISNQDKGLSSWLLRSKGVDSGHICVVNWNGTVSMNQGAESTFIGIRPAIKLTDTPQFAATPAFSLEIPSGAHVCGEDVTITATLPGDATGTVNFRVEGISIDAVYNFNGVIVENGIAQATGSFDAGDYNVIADYSGDGKYAPATAQTDLKVDHIKPSVSIEMENGISEIEYGNSVIVCVTIPEDATHTATAAGDISIKLNGQEMQTCDAENGILRFDLSPGKKLPVGDYTVSAVYNGDTKYSSEEAETAFSVTKAQPMIRMAAEPVNDIASEYEITLTKPKDSTEGIRLTVHREGNTDVDYNIGNADFQDGIYIASFPGDMPEWTGIPGEYTLTATYLGDTDPNYKENSCELIITAGCEHVWDTPEWNWDDALHPAYKANCTKCDDGKAEGTVNSVPGTRVEATVESDAYTPYTAFVTLGTQTFESSYNLVEPGTMQEARAAALEDYKAEQKDAADALAQEGDSEECASLISDAKAAIEELSYDESKPLDENKQAVDEIIAALEADLEEHRREYTATFVDENGTVLGEVKFTIDTKSIDEPAVPEKPGYTVTWEEYELGARDIIVHAVYTPADICPLDNEYHGTSFFGRVIKFIHTVIWKAFRLIKINIYFKISR